MAETKQLPLDTQYQVPVRGLGEIYEMISVERLRNSLLKKHGSGILTLTNPAIKSDDGYVDCPPWKCNPKEEGIPPNKLKIWLASVVFRILVHFEFIWRRIWEPHISYKIKYPG